MPPKLKISSPKLVTTFFVSLVLALSLLFVIAIREAFFKTTYVGFLSIGSEVDCLIPEGCGPLYRLYDLDKMNYTPLLGDIASADSGAVVKLKGEMVVLPKSEYRAQNYSGPTTAIRVDSYTLLDEPTFWDLFW
ncbi:MAG: hypothetical protein O2840_00585 [bacterium]|nr:hypothetical protein [bacterium]